MRTTVLALIALALAAPAAARDKAPPSGHAVGAPVNCIRVSTIRDTRRVDDRTIIFETNGHRFYRNDLPQRCPRLAWPTTAISYKVTTNELCSVDIIHILDNGGGGLQDSGSCGLGKFTPWEPDRKTR